jgi:hypothetical protein
VYGVHYCVLLWQLLLHCYCGEAPRASTQTHTSRHTDCSAATLHAQLTWCHTALRRLYQSSQVCPTAAAAAAVAAAAVQSDQQEAHAQ